MTEAQLQSAVVQCARLLGYDVYHTFNSRRSEPGYPDLTCIRRADRIGLPSRIVVIELKAERGRVSPDQERWLANFRAVGIPAYTLRPSDWHSGHIERVLKGEDA